MVSLPCSHDPSSTSNYEPDESNPLSPILFPVCSFQNYRSFYVCFSDFFTLALYILFYGFSFSNSLLLSSCLSASRRDSLPSVCCRLCPHISQQGLTTETIILQKTLQNWVNVARCAVKSVLCRCFRAVLWNSSARAGEERACRVPAATGP
jgi:hypothetical protein